MPPPVGVEGLDWPSRLALAVADPAHRALALDQSNQPAGWMSLATALDRGASGKPFAIRVRPDVLALDADQPEQTDRLNYLFDRLRRDSLVPVLLASGGADHRRHLFVRVPDPDQREGVIALAKRHGIDVRSGSALIRPPCSPHRSGGRSMLLHPADPAEAEAALAPVEPVAARPSRPIGPATLARLRVPVAAGGRSEAVRSILLGLVNAGLDEAEAWQVLGSAPAGSRYADGSRSRRHFAGEWARARAFVALHPPLADWGALASALDALVYDARHGCDWSGRSRETTLAVLDGLVALALRRGSSTFHASVREVGEQVGLGLPAVVAALRRLRAEGLVRRLDRGVRPRPGQVGRGSVWRLNVTFTEHPSAHPPDLNVSRTSHSPLPDPARLAGHDAFRHRALSKSCLPLVRLLAEADEPVAAGDLAVALGSVRESVSRQLSRLAAVGLAVRESGKRGRWSLAVDVEALVPSLDRIAFRLGTAGVGARARLVHAEQRRFLASPTPKPEPLPGATVIAIRRRTRPMTPNQPTPTTPTRAAPTTPTPTAPTRGAPALSLAEMFRRERGPARSFARRR